MRPRNLCVFGPKRPFKNVCEFYLCVSIYTILFYAIYINYANYICAILVLLSYSHKYSARINNRLYGTFQTSIGLSVITQNKEKYIISQERKVKH